MGISQNVNGITMQNLRHILFLCEDEDSARFSYMH